MNRHLPSHSEVDVLQKADEPRVGWLAEQLRDLALSSSSSQQGAGVLKVGALCLAQFTLDNQWYR